MVEEYIERRKKFIDLLPENSIAIVFGGDEIRMTADESFPFQIDHNLFYLTGIKQAQTILMIIKNSLEAKTYLFIQKFDALKEVWTGIRLKSAEAKAISGIENVLFLDNYEDKLDFSLKELDNPKIFLDFASAANYGDMETFVSVADYKKVLENKYKHIEILDSCEYFTRLRMIKSDFEISEMRKAIANTNKGLLAILKNLEPNKNEYDMAALFKYVVALDENSKLAFNTIAASGKNGVILHYPNPMNKLHNKDLVLFDLGSDHHEYKADISRTYPINGKYTKEQKKIYEIVLNCNKRIIAMIKPGLKISDLQEEARNFMAGELMKIGLIDDPKDIIKYYYHNVSHHLGLDTHDLSDRSLPLEPGNVITVEPGLYIKELEIGIRIEDDVLVTPEGSLCLSSEIAKEIVDIEALMKE